MHSRTSIALLLSLGMLLFFDGRANAQGKASSKVIVPNSEKARPQTPSEFETWLTKRPEFDLLFFKEEKYPPTEMRIEKVQRDQILVTRGTQQRTFKIEEIQAIQWHHREEDSALMKTASLSFLREACAFYASIFHLLDHTEESWVLAYLFRLLTAHSGLDHAVEINATSKLLREDSKDVKEFVSDVMKYRSTRMISNDSKLTPEVHEAKYFIESGRELPNFMMLHYLAQLAAVEDQARKDLEEEHPKWRDDEEIKPVRQRHFQLAMDMNLYPYLFESSQEAAASEGLLRAGKIAYQTGEIEVARKVWTDGIKIYPKSLAYAETQRLLSTLPRPETPAKTLKDEAGIPEKPSEDPPPKFLRFNLFEE